MYNNLTNHAVTTRAQWILGPVREGPPARRPARAQCARPCAQVGSPLREHPAQRQRRQVGQRLQRAPQRGASPASSPSWPSSPPGPAHPPSGSPDGQHELQRAQRGRAPGQRRQPRSELCDFCRLGRSHSATGPPARAPACAGGRTCAPAPCDTTFTATLCMAHHLRGSDILRAWRMYLGMKPHLPSDQQRVSTRTSSASCTTTPLSCSCSPAQRLRAEYT